MDAETATDLKGYWETLDTRGRQRFAKRAKTNTAYLSQLVHGHRRASPEMAKSLHEASGHKVPLEKLRPDIWAGVAA